MILLFYTQKQFDDDDDDFRGGSYYYYYTANLHTYTQYSVLYNVTVLFGHVSRVVRSPSSQWGRSRLNARKCN